MSSSKRNGKSKALTEENVRDHVNNYTMQTRKQLITTKLAKPRTVDNVNRNTGRLLGKNSLSKPNRRGKKDKATNASQPEDSKLSKKGSNDTPDGNNVDDDDDDNDNDEDIDKDNNDNNKMTTTR